MLLRTGKPAQADTVYSCSVQQNKVILDIRCLEPMADRIVCKAAGDGADLWKDDSVEIFFSSGDPSRLLNQFVISAGGARWMGRGGTGIVTQYSSWSADVRREKEAWTVHAEIPFSLLGWKETPKDSVLILIGRNRVPVKETSACVFVAESFHRKSDWAAFLPRGGKVWAETVKLQLAEKASHKTELAKRIRTWTPSGTPENDLVQIRKFESEINASKFVGRTFVLTLSSIMADTSVPYIPASLLNPPEKISARGAGNDIVFVPLALTNLKDTLEEYRIVVSAVDQRNREKGVLEKADGTPFPADRLSLLRGVRVKDGDEETHGLRYDPLSPMNDAQTVVVPPKESVPVWIRIDTSKIPPGIYSGVIRVIPLGEAGTRAKKNSSFRDMPFSFEVLPFTLSEKPPVRHFMFQSAFSKEHFQRMLEDQIDTFQVNPWTSSFAMDPKGNVVSRDTERMEQVIRDYGKWAKEYAAPGPIYLCFCYSAYPHFMKTITKGKFKPFTPEWETAWVNYMKEIDAVREKCGIPMELWSMELSDEPKEQLMPELIRAAELAVKAIPGLRLMMTFGAKDISMDSLQKLSPNIYEWCFWSTSILLSQKHASFLAGLRKAGKRITIYKCATSMRLDLQMYHRSLAWTVPYFHLDGCNMYEHVTHEYKNRDWKEAACGEVVLMSGDIPVTTIRNECVNAGLRDLKYFAVLRELYGKMDHASPLGKEIGKFLEETPKSIVMEPPANPFVMDRTRETMIDLILKARKH